MEEIKAVLRENINILRVIVDKSKSYYTGDISLEKLVCFLLQFKDANKISSVILMLQNLNFLSSEKITFLLNQAFLKVDETSRTEAVFCPIGSSQDSSSQICYSLFKKIFDRESEVIDRTIELSMLGKIIDERNPKSIIFLDDNITSGTQLFDFFNELSGISTKEYELVKSPLSTNQFEKLKKIKIHVCYAIRLTYECEDKIREINENLGLDIKVYSGAQDYNNYLKFSSPIYNTEEESKFAETFTIDFSKPLYQDKNWTRDTIYSRLLGYGNLGKLTVFYYNVPKSLIPFFWKTGCVNGLDWIPLFPERKEWEKCKDKDFDIYICELSKSIINDSQEIRQPKLKLYFFNSENEFSKDNRLVVNIPTINSIYTYLDDNLNKKYFEKEEHSQTYYSYGIHKMEEEEMPLTVYEKYSDFVDSQNEKVEEYYENLASYLSLISCQSTIKITINNSGNGKANNIRVYTDFKSKEIFFGKIDSIIPPQIDRQVYNLEDFLYKNYDGNYLPTSEGFSPYYIDQKISQNDYKLNKLYTHTKTVDHISHKEIRDYYDIIIFDRNAKEIELKHKIYFDESADCIEGSITLDINEIDYQSEELELLLGDLNNY